MASAHVSKFFFLSGASLAGGIKAEDRGPNKGGGSFFAGSTQLAFQQRSPHFLIVAPSKDFYQPVAYRNAFQAAAIFDAGGIKHAASKPELFPKRKRGEFQKIDGGAHGIEMIAGEETYFGLAPAHLGIQTKIMDES